MKANKKYSQVKMILGIILGAIMVIVGVSLIFMPDRLPERFHGVIYVLVGLGVGIISQMISNRLEHKASIQNPEHIREIAIEQKDERNQMIRNKAKVKTYQFMFYVYTVLLIVFTLVASQSPYYILLPIFYIVMIGYNIYWINRYNREL